MQPFPTTSRSPESSKLQLAIGNWHFLAPHSPFRTPRSGFTLMELLVVVAIIGILAALTAAALAGATQTARAQRTRAVIAKLDALIGEKWESYRTRTVPIQVPAGTAPLWSARLRLYGLRELQRMELPDRVTDVCNGTAIRLPVVLNSPASLQLAYFRMAQRATGGNVSNWTPQHQGSECLYLILSAMRDGDKSAIDFLTTSEIGDTDGDGMKEVLDGWGRPIEFLRWAPGYRADVAPNPVTFQIRDPSRPDPFDPVKVDPRVCQVNMPAYGPFAFTAANTNANDDTFALRPLIFSAGADKSYDVNVEGNLIYTAYSATQPPNDPYYLSASNTQAGMVGDIDGDGYQGWMDNITNHFQEAE